MIIRSKAPLRLGMAGGGTDVTPYSSLYGGFILNATIDLYAYCIIEEKKNNEIQFISFDQNKKLRYPSKKSLPITGELDIHKAVYNRIIKEYGFKNSLSFKMTTFSDSPPGSGLGSSSALVVAIVKAFSEWLSLPLGEYEIAKLSYEIERRDLNFTGGKQDQYSATFGGFNFMEFHKDDRVIINPLSIKRWIVDELESSIVLFYTGVSRSSERIIKEQIANVNRKSEKSLNAMHRLKQDAVEMKDSLLKGDIKEFSNILGHSWEYKKQMAKSITNTRINEIYESAIKSGAYSGKVSGAGGGGFMFFVVDPSRKMVLVNKLNKFKGYVTKFHFSEGGCHCWKIFE